MDVDTFGTNPFHPQQNRKLFCCEPLFAYFYCSIESNNCFSLVLYYI